MEEPRPYFRVYQTGEWPKPKKHYFSCTFGKRQTARNFCRNQRGLTFGLTIVHPDGTEEKYERENN